MFLFLMRQTNMGLEEKTPHLSLFETCRLKPASLPLNFSSRADWRKMYHFSSQKLEKEKLPNVAANQ